MEGQCRGSTHDGVQYMAVPSDCYPIIRMRPPSQIALVGRVAIARRTEKTWRNGPDGTVLSVSGRVPVGADTHTSKAKDAGNLGFCLYNQTTEVRFKRGICPCSHPERHHERH